MTIAEQALFLLDLRPSELHRKNLESFFNLDSLVSGSVGILPALDPVASELPTNSFSVASRLSRSNSNYEEQAKAEALMNALKHIRSKNDSIRKSTRVIQGS